MRIEVGRGLEGALTDATCEPHHQRHHRAAVQAGRFLRRHQRRPRPDDPRHRWRDRCRRPIRPGSPSGTGGVPWPVLIVGGLVFGSMLSRMLGRGVGARAIAGLIGGGIAWWLTSRVLFGARGLRSVCSSWCCCSAAAAWRGPGAAADVARSATSDGGGFGGGWRWRRLWRRRRIWRRRRRQLRRRRRLGALVVSSMTLMRTLPPPVRHALAVRGGVSPAPVLEPSRRPSRRRSAPPAARSASWSRPRSSCPRSVAGLAPRERAMQIFSDLHVWDTELRNGVLIYVLLADRDVEILADRGAAARDRRRPTGKRFAGSWKAISAPDASPRARWPASRRGRLVRTPFPGRSRPQS